MATDNNIREILTNQGRKQAWLCERLGITRPTLAAYMDGKSEVPFSRMLEIASVLGVTPSEVFPALVDCV